MRRILLDAETGAAAAGDRGHARADVDRLGQEERRLAVDVGKPRRELQRTGIEVALRAVVDAERRGDAEPARRAVVGDGRTRRAGRDAEIQRAEQRARQALAAEAGFSRGALRVGLADLGAAGIDDPITAAAERAVEAARGVGRVGVGGSVVALLAGAGRAVAAVERGTVQILAGILAARRVGELRARQVEDGGVDTAAGEIPLGRRERTADLRPLLERHAGLETLVHADVVGRHLEERAVAADPRHDAFVADRVGEGALRIEQQDAVGTGVVGLIDEIAVLQIRLGARRGQHHVALAGGDVAARRVAEARHHEPDAEPGVVRHDRARRDRRAEVGVAGGDAEEAREAATGVALDGDDPVAAEVGARGRRDLDELVAIDVAALCDVVVVELVDPRLHGRADAGRADADVAGRAEAAVGAGAAVFRRAGRRAAVAVEKIAVVALLGRVGDAVAARFDGAVGATAVAGRRVAVVAGLGAARDAVAAGRRRAVGVAAVAVLLVAVVAELGRIDDAVAAERLAGDRRPLAAEPRGLVRLEGGEAAAVAVGPDAEPDLGERHRSVQRRERRALHLDAELAAFVEDALHAAGGTELVLVLEAAADDRPVGARQRDLGAHLARRRQSERRRRRAERARERDQLGIFDEADRAARLGRRRVHLERELAAAGEGSLSVDRSDEHRETRQERAGEGQARTHKGGPPFEVCACAMGGGGKSQDAHRQAGAPAMACFAIGHYRLRQRLRACAEPARPSGRTTLTPTATPR